MRDAFAVMDRPRLLHALETLLQALLKGPGQAASEGLGGFRNARVPQALLDSIHPHNEVAPSVHVSGAGYLAYRRLLEDLGELRETEWLEPDALEQRLWTLVCEVSLSPSAFASNSQRRDRAESFLGEVIRDVQAYAVLFTVEHVTPPNLPVAVWDSTLSTGTPELLLPFVRVAPSEMQAHLASPFIGRTVLTVEVEGTAAGPTIERGRLIAERRLHVLRGTLAGHFQVDPRQLRFALGEHVIASSLAGGTPGLQSWSRQPSAPIDLQFHAGLNERLIEAQDLWRLLASAHPTVRERVSRAYEWLGMGLCRTWPGDALRDFATGLEVLLVTSETEQASVLVPYRMLALADLRGSSAIHPAKIRYAFYLRGSVVHQGKGDAGGQESARTLRDAITDCAKWFAHWAAAHPSEDHDSLLLALDTPALRTKAREWLAQFPDMWSQMLSDGIRSIPKPDSDDFRRANELLLKSWRQHRTALAALSKRSPRTYIDFSAHALSRDAALDPSEFAFRLEIADQIRALIGEVNIWNYSLAKLSAWSEVLTGLDEDARPDVLLEHIQPLAESALNSAYRLKQHMVFTAQRALDYLDTSPPPIDEQKITYLTLVPLLKKCASGAALETALGTIDSEAFRSATSDYRRRHQHRSSPAVEVGVRFQVSRFVRREGVGFGFGTVEPLPLEVIVRECQAEHSKASAALKCLWTLIKEVETKLRSRATPQSPSEQD